MFIDGTKLEANANKHSYVWKKSLEYYEEAMMGRAKALVDEINRTMGSGLALRAGNEIIDLSNVLVYVCGLKGEVDEKTLGKWKKELIGYQNRAVGYDEKKQMLGGRNSCSKTDKDATFMRMKDESLKAGYNAQIAVEGEYVVGAEILQCANDQPALKPLVKTMKERRGSNPKAVTTDAGYESEENYVFLEEQGIKAYIKPSNREVSKTGKFKKDISKRENMAYNSEKDEYTCANKKVLRVIGTGTRTSTSGYKAEMTIYECESCEGCPVKEQCTKAKGNRQMEVSKLLLKKREASLANISGEEGIVFRVNRSIQVEGAFGVEKEDWGFRRFKRRGKTGVKTEFLLLCFGYNINKMHNKIQGGRIGVSLHPVKPKKPAAAA